MMSKWATSALICLLMLAGACHKKPKAGVPAPPLFAHTIVVSNAPPEFPQPRRLNIQPFPIPPPMDPYQTAVGYFQDGNYKSAAQALDEYLKDPDLKNQEGALFYLAMSRSFLTSSASPREMRIAIDAFDELLARYPESQYRARAEIIRRLLEKMVNERSEQARLQKELKEKDDQIEQLKDELQKLKEIDMQRRPSRPPP
jgi:hypothetical protein